MCDGHLAYSFDLLRYHWLCFGYIYIYLLKKALSTFIRQSPAVHHSPCHDATAHALSGGGCRSVVTMVDSLHQWFFTFSGSGNSKATGFLKNGK
jgi:hypothetical protein